MEEKHKIRKKTTQMEEKNDEKDKKYEKFPKWERQ